MTWHPWNSTNWLLLFQSHAPINLHGAPFGSGWSGHLKPLEKGFIPRNGKAGLPLHPKHFKAYIFALLGTRNTFVMFWGCPIGLHTTLVGNAMVRILRGAPPPWASRNWTWKSQHGKNIPMQTCWLSHGQITWCSNSPMWAPKMFVEIPCTFIFCKGIYSHVIDGVLHYACWWEGPGKVCKERPWKRLALIFEEGQLEYKAQGLNNRLTNLKLSMLTDAQKPWVSKACLDIKAGEAKHLLPALVPVLEKIFGDTRKEEEQKMISAAKSLEKLVALWDAASTFLTSSEVEKAMNLGKEFLLAYKWLHAWSLEKGRNSFSTVNKFHTFIHMWMGCKFTNPKKQWCFKGEDYVGHISKMAHSISFGVSSTRISNKLCPKYRVLQHFIICRDMEQLPWKDEADD